MRELHDRYSSPSSRVDKVEKTHDKCAARLTTFEEKMADLEDQSRRDNVRIMNLPEGMEQFGIITCIVPFDHHESSSQRPSQQPWQALHDHYEDATIHWSWFDSLCIQKISNQGGW